MFMCCGMVCLCRITVIKFYDLFFDTGGLSSGIEQLRTCNRCHRVFPVLSDLFNHMCDDEDDLLQKKPTPSSSNKYTSDNVFNNKTTLDSSSLFDKKSSPNQESSSSSSARSFKLNRRSSFNDSSLSSLRSKKLFSPISPPSTPIHKQHINSTSIHVSPISRSNNNKSPLDTTYIPFLKRPLFRTDSNNFSRISSSPSPRPSFNDKQSHSSSAYVYLRNPSSPMRVTS
jgi:hypothetical protein